ncbi:hypothetical protein GCM10018793_29870 [Streptomyces sulfonofaciens]|uniref:non-specific serine/threonine protein kinase n=1 Tax=Streptomyces sulfonofaciens TaxID=68272 RepID=A0A919G6G4_9ACTN|nr:serine/threonine-protein kinase [Streptomyces sulfonofaciens]GHH78704.1 hypothetical protein GCM10018793_29870 [Streptomyces sulfonofaciens]
MSEAEQAGETRKATGTRLLAGRYRLGKVLGRGGMGTVWRAEDEVLGRTVAVKELRFPSSDEDENRRLITRTLREAKAIARIRNNSAVTVFDVVDEDDRPWIVMELVEGKSLAEVIREDGVLTPRRAAEVGLAVLDVLRAAHREGILHRDVKPSNVLIADDGRVVLTDFGIAQVEGDPSITSTGMLVGAPSYISPERARGYRPGPAADMWSLGGLLYACVEGTPPYDKGSAIATLTAVMTEPLERPKNAGPLEPVIYGLLAKDVEQRLDDAGARAMLMDVVHAPEPKAPASDRTTTLVLPGEERRPAAGERPDAPTVQEPDAAGPSSGAADSGARSAPAGESGKATGDAPERGLRGALRSVRKAAAAATGAAATAVQGKSAAASPGSGAAAGPASGGPASHGSGAGAPGAGGASAERAATGAAAAAPGTGPAKGADRRAAPGSTGAQGTAAEAARARPGKAAAEPSGSEAAGRSGAAPAAPSSASSAPPRPSSGRGPDAPSAAGSTAADALPPDAAPPADRSAPGAALAGWRKRSSTGGAGSGGAGTPGEQKATAPGSDGRAAPSGTPAGTGASGPGARDTASAGLGSAAHGPAATAPPGTFGPAGPPPSGTAQRRRFGPVRNPRRALLIAAIVIALVVLGTVLALTLPGDDGTPRGGRDTGGGTAASGGGTSGGKGDRDGSGGGGRSDDGKPDEGRGAAKGSGGGAGDDGKQSGGSSGGTGTGTGTGQDAPATTYTDPQGFSIGLPKGWQRTTTDRTGVHFTGPDGQALLLAWTTSPKPSPVLDWHEQEHYMVLSQYKRIRIDGLEYRGWPAADWEFTFVSHGTQRRRIDRGFVVGPKLGYGMMYTAKAGTWDSDLRRSTWDTFTRTFQPKK